MVRAHDQPRHEDQADARRQGRRRQDRTAPSNSPRRSSTRPANIALMHQVVVAQLAAARQGTHSTKTRGEVRGGGKKPYRQKGTGRARQGSTRAPQFAGGGTVHGPQPRDYSQRTPKKMKAAALRGALSDRARNERIHVITELVAGQTPSTKSAQARSSASSRTARSSWSSSAARTSPHGRACRTCTNVHPDRTRPAQHLRRAQQRRRRVQRRGAQRVRSRSRRERRRNKEESK